MFEDLDKLVMEFTLPEYKNSQAMKAGKMKFIKKMLEDYINFIGNDKAKLKQMKVQLKNFLRKMHVAIIHRKFFTKFHKQERTELFQNSVVMEAKNE